MSGHALIRYEGRHDVLVRFRCKCGAVGPWSAPRRAVGQHWNHQKWPDDPRYGIRPAGSEVGVLPDPQETEETTKETDR